jgi:hypothetical protein
MPLLMLSDLSNFTLALGITACQSQCSQDTARILACTRHRQSPRSASPEGGGRLSEGCDVLRQ